MTPYRAMLYRIELPSNTATPLALFGRSLQTVNTVALFVPTELLCWRLAVFGAYCVSSGQSYTVLGDSKLKRQRKFSATDILDGIIARSILLWYENRIISDERTDIHTDSQRLSVTGYRIIAYQRRILFLFQGLMHHLLMPLYRRTKFQKLSFKRYQ